MLALASMRARRALLVLSCALGAGCAPASELESDEASDQSEHRLDVRPGDPVPLASATVIAPEAGLGVFAEVLFDDGRTETLHLRTGLDEVVMRVDSTPVVSEQAGEEGGSVAEQAGEASAPGATKPCSDGAKNPLPYHVDGTLSWRFNAGSSPGGNAVADVEAALIRAAGNITKSRNSCGLADLVDVKHAYAGRTTKGAQIGADATCKAQGNGLDSVGFGALPEGVLGLACVFYDGTGAVVEADIRLNAARAWYAEQPASCTNRYSIEAVATHEFGHVFGLGHVAEGAHGNLTMSPQINGPCQSSEATLGRGDVLGLRAKY